MNKYEMIYILDTACTDEKRDALIEKIENVVVKAGGTVEKTEKWGIKKLAYVYMAFEGDCDLVQEMKRVIGIAENVIRRLITKR